MNKPFASVHHFEEDGEEKVAVTARQGDVRVIHTKQGKVIRVELSGEAARAVRADS